MKKIYLFLLLFSGLYVFAQSAPWTSRSTGLQTWTAPCDVTSITVEIWGAGGGGANAWGGRNTSAIRGGGGSGGGYIRTTYNVTPGSIYKLFVGLGGAGNTNGQGSWFNDSKELFAVGGNGASDNSSTGSAAPAVGNIGGTLNSSYGGNGGVGSSSGSGGGGSSGGSTSSNNASGITGGAAPTDGYAGAAGTTIAGTNGLNGGIGAGGSGGYKADKNSSTVGGKGGNGQVRITFNSKFKNYCEKLFSTVEPITNVTFAGINNTTSGVVNESPALESFCLSANVTQGQTYPISVRGNTNGNLKDYFRVYIDWNQNGNFGEAGESFNIGVIENSVGNVLTASANVVVPNDALLGITRMRVVKNFASYTDACSTASYGQAEEYTVNISAAPPCMGTPSGGTASLSSSSGLPSSNFTASVVGSSETSGLSYQWQTSTSETGPWVSITDQTSQSASLTANSTIGTTYYRLKVTCNASGNSEFSTVVSYITQYCTIGISATASTNYIKMVKFIGTLRDIQNPSTYSTSPNGYQNFTSLSDKSEQAQNNGVNLYVENLALGVVMAWVDWNRDGTFDTATEQVYSSRGTSISSTTFGFVIPADAIPGPYTIRIRMNNSGGSDSFQPCGVINNAGETEDYTFLVKENCAANVTAATDDIRFGAGAVNLKTTVTATSTEVRWYSSLTGGTLLKSTPVTAGSSSWSPDVSETTVFYITAWNGTCESLVRTPIKATVRPIPVITFTPASPVACGSESTIKISAAGQNETYYFIDEKFNSDLGVFSNSFLVGNSATFEAKTKWQNQQSTFTPKEKVWFPAIASGISGNRFVMSTSDIGSSTTHNALVSPVINAAGYTDLTLKFRMYYSRYIADNDPGTSDYVEIEVSKDQGASWTSIERIIADVGYGTQFTQKQYNLSAFISDKVQFRIRYYANFRDGIAIDDVELFGVKPLTTSFSWTSSAPINVYTDAAATIPYNQASGATTVYMNPSLDQKETTASWTINASATLTNGTSTSGTVTIENKNRVWNNASDNWNASIWKPIQAVPTIDECVYIKTPVQLGAAMQGYAKEVFIEPTGKLTINSNAALKVKDAFVNKTTAANVVVESDGNLIQVNENPTINSGSITVKRDINVSAGRQQYNYIISPVENQNLRTIYPGIEQVIYHSEASNYFYNSSGAYIKGRALAVKEPKASVVLDPQNSKIPALFTGYPTNGAFTFTIANSNPLNMQRGFNLVGNPYPSNMDLIEFYKLNGGSSGPLNSTFNLWDNRANSQIKQMGDNYGGQAYTTFNVAAPPTSGTGTLATGDPGLVGIVRAIRYVKVGQGFMLRSSAPSYDLKFNNTIRVAENFSESFFGKGNGKGNKDAEVDRYWLNLVDSANIASNIAVVYFEGGNNDFAPDDSRSKGGSDVIYSLAGDANVVINGRNSFNTSDVVFLGTNHFAEGEYKIEVSAREGIFGRGQQIYLKDKKLGILANITREPYIFKATAGASTGRFEIVYRRLNNMKIATDEKAVTEVAIYRNGSDYNIVSALKNITGIQLYDMSGRMIMEKESNSASVIIDGNQLINGTYIVRINREGEIISRKIIK